jgi:hypothetical protein
MLRDMPKGPQGQKRPADVIGNAIRVAKIATGEEDEDELTVTQEKASKGGNKGGKARAAALSPTERSKIASMAASARWKKT